MIHGQHLKTVAYSTPLFHNAVKAYPFTHPNSVSYLMLYGQQTNDQLFSKESCKFICPSFSNQTDDCCFIVLEGQCLHRELLSKKNEVTNTVMTEQQIWCLILCMCQAFMILKNHRCADKLTHLKQYSIRKIANKNSFKLIYHESMISQLQFSSKASSKWDELYLSPEQLDNNFVPQKSIVFSFGCILLNICSNSDKNRTIYKKNVYEVDQLVIKQKINIAKQNYGYSKILCNFIQACLKLDHRQRYDFEQLREALYIKLDRQFLKQSQLLSQIKQLENGKSKSMSYQIWLPPNYASRETFDYQKLQNKQNSKQKLKSPQREKSPTLVKNSQQAQNKKLKRKASLKFQGSKINKQKKQKQQKKGSTDGLISKNVPEKEEKYAVNNNSQIVQNNQQTGKKQQKKSNIQYRGTFGVKGLINEHQFKFEEGKGRTTKKKREIEQIQQYDNEQENTKSKQHYYEKQEQGMQGNDRINKKLIKQYNNLEETSVQILNMSGGPIKLQIYCNESIIQQFQQNAENQLRNSQIESHRQTLNSQPDTPRGFGHFHFHETRIDNQSSLKYQCDESTSISPNLIEEKGNRKQIPQLIQSLGPLKLQICLKPIEQLIQMISKIGVWVEGDLYYGDFQNGRRNGFALEIFANGEYYLGNFKEDLFSGIGFYYWNSREYFLGKFELGQKIWGRLQGEVQYQGGFENSKRHGEGTCWYSTGQIYSGSWQNGKRHGHGTVIQPDRVKFVGNWIKGKRKGEGYLQTDALRIAGNWDCEVIVGQALIQYNNGDVFKGKTGPTLQKLQGQYISNSGRIFKGIFENDQPRKGELMYSNGDKYIGELQNMRRNGYGQYYYSTGEIYKGMWDNNQKKS